MIAPPSLDRRVSSMDSPSRPEASRPVPSRLQIRLLLRKAGRYENLLRTIAAAPLPEPGRRAVRD
ncbi:hypothetical protein [Tautonia sociabilis]|uniref:hypothetical protein n=1 Tax=Tautonia sociabilis TaxID=2080755 RepID=UPI001315A381|nr:hypothetical protein [Tautonia sociabilis]